MSAIRNAAVSLTAVMVLIRLSVSMHDVIPNLGVIVEILNGILISVVSIERFIDARDLALYVSVTYSVFDQ